jgi:hypothetical protein
VYTEAEALLMTFWDKRIGAPTGNLLGWIVPIFKNPGKSYRRGFSSPVDIA